MKIGRRLAIKILNASKFVLADGVSMPEDLSVITDPLDQAMLAVLANVITDATAAFDDYNYARALEVTETFFWAFCDDYVELVKERAYGVRGPEAAASAKAALAVALSVMLRLFSPVLPFVAEEVWSWWCEGSIHRAAWPTADECGDARGDAGTVDAVATVLSGVRKAKSEAKVSMKADVSEAVVTGPSQALDRVRSASADLAAAGRIEQLRYVEGSGPLSVDVTLA